MLNIGKEIYNQRIVLKLSINELSRQTGVVVSTIARLENESYKFISQDNFDKLNLVLDLKGYEEYISKDTSYELSKLLKKKRAEKGYSQKELSMLCGYKDTSTIGKLETGRSSKIYTLTFLRLQEALSLLDEEFEPYIKEVKTKQKKKLYVNYEVLQKLVIDKRKKLKLSYTELAIQSHTAIRTVQKIEHSINEVNILSTLRLIKFLSFSKEEIEECIPDLEDEYIEYLLEDKKIYQKERKYEKNTRK